MVSVVRIVAIDLSVPDVVSSVVNGMILVELAEFLTTTRK